MFGQSKLVDTFTDYPNVNRVEVIDHRENTNAEEKVVWRKRRNIIVSPTEPDILVSIAFQDEGNFEDFH